jgi:putative Mn2+ efflux pump MntP
MGFLLLGTDSLIACIAVGPIIGRRIAIPLAILFGVGDGGGFLLGTAFHWSVSDSFSTFIATSVLAILGVYWIAVAIYSKWATAKDPESTRARWAVWILPWALSVDNITYGLVSGVPAHASVWFSAGEQTLSSAVQAGIGILIAWGLVALFPVLKRQMSLSFAFCGVASIAAASAMVAFPSAF